MNVLEATVKEARRYGITVSAAARQAGVEKKNFYNAMSSGRVEPKDMRPAERKLFAAMVEMLEKEQRYNARIVKKYGNR